MSQYQTRNYFRNRENSSSSFSQRYSNSERSRNDVSFNDNSFMTSTCYKSRTRNVFSQSDVNRNYRKNGKSGYRKYPDFIFQENNENSPSKLKHNIFLDVQPESDDLNDSQTNRIRYNTKKNLIFRTNDDEQQVKKKNVQEVLRSNEKSALNKSNNAVLNVKETTAALKDEEKESISRTKSTTDNGIKNEKTDNSDKSKVYSELVFSTSRDMFRNQKVQSVPHKTEVGAKYDADMSVCSLESSQASEISGNDTSKNLELSFNERCLSPNISMIKKEVPISPCHTQMSQFSIPCGQVARDVLTQENNGHKNIFDDFLSQASCQLEKTCHSHCDTAKNQKSICAYMNKGQCSKISLCEPQKSVKSDTLQDPPACRDCTNADSVFSLDPKVTNTCNLDKKSLQNCDINRSDTASQNSVVNDGDIDVTPPTPSKGNSSVTSNIGILRKPIKIVRKLSKHDQFSAVNGTSDINNYSVDGPIGNHLSESSEEHLIKKEKHSLKLHSVSSNVKENLEHEMHSENIDGSCAESNENSYLDGSTSCHTINKTDEDKTNTVRSNLNANKTSEFSDKVDTKGCLENKGLDKEIFGQGKVIETNCFEESIASTSSDQNFNISKSVNSENCDGKHSESLENILSSVQNYLIRKITKYNQTGIELQLKESAKGKIVESHLYSLPESNNADPNSLVRVTLTVSTGNSCKKNKKKVSGNVQSEAILKETAKEKWWRPYVQSLLKEVTQKENCNISNESSELVDNKENLHANILNNLANDQKSTLDNASSSTKNGKRKRTESCQSSGTSKFLKEDKNGGVHSSSNSKIKFEENNSQNTSNLSMTGKKNSKKNKYLKNGKSANSKSKEKNKILNIKTEFENDCTISKLAQKKQNKIKGKNKSKNQTSPVLKIDKNVATKTPKSKNCKEECKFENWKTSVYLSQKAKNITVKLENLEHTNQNMSPKSKKAKNKTSKSKKAKNKTVKNADKTLTLENIKNCVNSENVANSTLKSNKVKNNTVKSENGVKRTPKSKKLKKNTVKSEKEVNKSPKWKQVKNNNVKLESGEKNTSKLGKVKKKTKKSKSLEKNNNTQSEELNYLNENQLQNTTLKGKKKKKKKFC